MSNTIVCTNCQSIIPLDKALSEQITKAQKDLALEYQKKYQKQSDDLEEQKKRLEESRKAVDQEVAKKLENEKKALWEIAQKKANERIEGKYNLELKDLREQTKEKEVLLKEAQKKELELRKQARVLEEKEKNMELEVQRKIDVEKKKIEQQAKEFLGEEYRKKLGEKDQQVDQMRKTIEELKRKSEQGSMQLQGDAQENNLKQLLLNAFPFDVIEDVATGIRGADLVHLVRNNFGQQGGQILWESKNTKQWSNEWIKKLKDDQVKAKADLAIIATTAMPVDIINFGFKEGVWVVEYRFVLALAYTLRFHLLEVSKVQQSIMGRDEKMDFLYNYLSGPQFKNRIENIVSAFTGLQEGLNAEKRAMERIWNKREKEIERVILNTSGLYGDMQGIIALPMIQQLELVEGEA